MKKVIAILIFCSLNINYAYADEYQLRDAQGNVLNVIECTAEICGNINSLYSVLTLKKGESYVRTDKNPVFAKETNPYEIVTKVNADNTLQITHVEPIQVDQNVLVKKKTEQTFNQETSVMKITENAPVIGASIEIDKKIETSAPQETITELELWWANLVKALNDLFAMWVWA